MKHWIAAAALIAGVAEASPVINFEGISAGCNVDNYYNNGTDSCGERGPNYGIAFKGATVYEYPDGKYASGYIGISFAPHSDFTRLDFEATGIGWDGNAVYAAAGDRVVDAWWINGQDRWIDGERHWHSLPPIESALDYSWGYLPTVTSFGIGASFLDNLTFVAPYWNATNPIVRAGEPAELPEPGMLALLGIGAVLLARSTLKKVV
jgi:hypothetical protein